MRCDVIRFLHRFARITFAASAPQRGLRCCAEGKTSTPLSGRSPWTKSSSKYTGGFEPVYRIGAIALAALVGPSLVLPLFAQQVPATNPSKGDPGVAPFSATATPPAEVAPGLTLLDAVQATLTQNPQLKIQQLQVQVSQGSKQIATGAFDFEIASNAFQQRSITPLTTYQQVSGGTSAADQVSETTTINVQAGKLFRDGVSVTPTVNVARTVDNLLSLTGTNTANVLLQVTIPLLQGRGKPVVDAQEIAATQEVTATQLDVQQLIAQLMTATVVDYWNLVGAYKVLGIDIESERRGIEYRDNVQALIDADAVPRNDLNAVVANLAQRAATRAQAQQQLVAARQQLSLDMGTSAEAMLTGLQPSDDFPVSATIAPLLQDVASLHVYLDSALANRGDYRAAQTRTQETETLLVPAKNRLLPVLNVTASVGYNGLNEGRQLTTLLTPLGTNVYGPVAVGGLSFSYPPQNNVARGLLKQNEAAVGQAKARAGDLARNISALIVSAAAAVNNATVQTGQARLSVAAYQAALTAQRDRYRLGTGSIVEILTIEDLLTGAMLSQVQAETAYAQAVTQFRYAAGMLIARDQAVQVLSPDTFRTFPAVALDPNR